MAASSNGETRDIDGDQLHRRSLVYMPPVRNVATGLSEEELRLLREAVERHVPELEFLLTDTTHLLTLDEADKLVDAIAHELSLGEDGALDERGIAFDNLIGRVNLGPYVH